MNYFITKIPNKRELQQIAFNHSSDINFKDFMNLYKKFTAKPYSFLVMDATLVSDNFHISEKNVLKNIQKIILTIDYKIRYEKLQYNINREAAKIKVLTSGKIDTFEYFTGEEILPFDQSRIIEQAKFTYSPLVKAFEKETKTIEKQYEQQIKPFEGHGKQLIEYRGQKDSLELLKQKKI